MTAMRVAVYLRQSKDRDGNQLAVSRQRDECVKLCEAKGWTTTVYVDNDISATNGKVKRTERELARLRRELKPTSHLHIRLARSGRGDASVRLTTE